MFQKKKTLKTRISTSLSDNQVYPQVCIDATYNYELFNNFRQNRTYQKILEHVTPEHGQVYLDLFKNDQSLVNHIEEFKKNDEQGNPSLYHYDLCGDISPSTLRYIKVLSDLKTHFSSLDLFSICEIGVGYGGQCRVINSFFKPESYQLVDIQPALGLTQRYLDNYILNGVTRYSTMNELEKTDYDLVISNYAFTELPRSIQDVYLEKIILNSSRGYITYNEITPPEFNSYKLDELLEKIKGSETFKEEPLTNEKNCIIVWGHKA